MVQSNLEQRVANKLLIRTINQHLQLLLEMWMKKEANYKIKRVNNQIRWSSHTALVFVFVNQEKKNRTYTEREVPLQEVTIMCTKNAE